MGQMNDRDQKITLPVPKRFQEPEAAIDAAYAIRRRLEEMRLQQRQYLYIPLCKRDGTPYLSDGSDALLLVDALLEKAKHQEDLAIEGAPEILEEVRESLAHILRNERRETNNPSGRRAA